MRAEEIKIITKIRPAWRIYFHLFMIFALLTAAAAVPRVLFGGAWIIDFVIVVFLIAILVLAKRASDGQDVVMTKEELKEWANDPASTFDIKSWRIRKKADQ